jgi:hypothetical protein
MTHDDLPSGEFNQFKMIEILSSIQTTQKFILDSMKEVKNEVKRAYEAVQGHALILQGHSSQLELLNKLTTTQTTMISELQEKVLVLEAVGGQEKKSSWSAENLKVVGLLSSAIVVLLEIVKKVVEYATSIHAVAK